MSALTTLAVPSSHATPLPGWAVGVFVGVWAVAAVFVVTKLVRRGRSGS